MEYPRAVQLIRNVAALIHVVQRVPSAVARTTAVKREPLVVGMSSVVLRVLTVMVEFVKPIGNFRLFS